MTAPGAPIREWSDAELRRMQSVVESGTVKLEEVGRRFRCSRHTVVALITSHGWRNPHAEQTAKYVGKPPKPKPKKNGKGWNHWGFVCHEPDDLCGGRRLTGAEFKKRAAELEARDQAERARALA